MRGLLSIAALAAMVSVSGPAEACDGFARVAVLGGGCNAQVVVQRQVIVPRVRTVVARVQPVQVQKVVVAEEEAEASRQAQVIQQPVQTVKVLRVVQPVCASNVCAVREAKVRTRRGLFGRRITRIVERR